MSEVDQGRKVNKFYSNYGRLNQTNLSLIYQYRNLDSFWSILDSDCFWASNARFSNDKEEQTMGICELKKLLRVEEKEKLHMEDCYIVCFCKEDDKLSQWRGYASNGVSIGFDFHAVLPFYVEQKVQVYNSCYDVYYIGHNTEIEKLEAIFKVPLGAEGNVDKLPRHIPYIKHRGFEEEDECRLVFFNKDGDMNAYVHYRMGERQERIPYIKVGLKSEEDKKRNCAIRMMIPDILNKKNKINAIYKEISDKTMALNAKVIGCFDPPKPLKSEYDDTLCWGCSQRVVNPMRDCKEHGYKFIKCGYMKNLGLDEGETRHFSACTNCNYIMISAGKNQEDVFRVVDEIITKYNNDPKNDKISIWCEGHLPIRTITVGPVENREEIRESIEHFCRNHYWLKYVQVKVSAIPYRS